MTNATIDTRPAGIPALIARADAALAAVPASLALFVLRLALAVPFFKSGLTKWDGFLQLSGGARFLFEQEFKLHILGSQYPYPFPLAAATFAGLAEIVLPILLVLGLGTRFAAFALLVMTAVVQLTVPEGWANFHLPWAAMALALMVWGSGKIALDPLIMRGSLDLGHRTP